MNLSQDLSSIEVGELMSNFKLIYIDELMPKSCVIKVDEMTSNLLMKLSFLEVVPV